MEKNIVSEEEYIGLLNEELRNHQLYQEGMEVIASPEGATGHEISGYSLRGGKDWPVVLADVAHKVSQSHVVKVKD